MVQPGADDAQDHDPYEQVPDVLGVFAAAPRLAGRQPGRQHGAEHNEEPVPVHLERPELKLRPDSCFSYLKNRLYVRTVSTKPVKIVYFQLCSITAK